MSEDLIYVTETPASVTNMQRYGQEIVLSVEEIRKMWANGSATPVCSAFTKIKEVRA